MDGYKARHRMRYLFLSAGLGLSLAAGSALARDPANDHAYTNKDLPSLQESYRFNGDGDIYTNEDLELQEDVMDVWRAAYQAFSNDFNMADLVTGEKLEPRFFREGKDYVGRISLDGGREWIYTVRKRTGSEDFPIDSKADYVVTLLLNNYNNGLSVESFVAVDKTPSGLRSKNLGYKMVKGGAYSSPFVEQEQNLGDAVLEKAGVPAFRNVFYLDSETGEEIEAPENRKE